MTPTRPVPTLAAARQFLQQGRLEEAESICRNVLKKNKKEIEALRLLGMIASARGDFPAAQSHLEKALRSAPDSPALLYGLAKVHTYQGRFTKALARYREALKVKPSDAGLLAGKAEALERMGDGDAARETLRPVVESGKENAEVAAIYASLLRKHGAYREALELIGRHAHSAEAVAEARLGGKLLYEAGHAFEKLEAYDDAFQAFHQANDRTKIPFDSELMRRQVDGVLEVFRPEKLDTYARASIETDLPIFIVGMPRCGSTLVEQILDAHPKIHGAGELDALTQLVRLIPQELRSSFDYPEIAAELDERAANRFSARYITRLRRLDRSAVRIVDKALNNFGFLGLIALLFPAARVIHCRRDPVATCLSCFIQPLPPEMYPYSTDLRSLGQCYCQYDRMMRHWRDTLPLAMMDLQYETLIADQEAESRRLIEFCGVDWDDACLDFHRTGRTTTTLSYDQVRQPIYTTALARHDRYDAHLGPLKEALAEGGLL